MNFHLNFEIYSKGLDGLPLMDPFFYFISEVFFEIFQFIIEQEELFLVYENPQETFWTRSH